MLNSLVSATLLLNEIPVSEAGSNLKSVLSVLPFSCLHEIRNNAIQTGVRNRPEWVNINQKLATLRHNYSSIYEEMDCRIAGRCHFNYSEHLYFHSFKDRDIRGIYVKSSNFCSIQKYGKPGKLGKMVEGFKW